MKSTLASAGSQSGIAVIMAILIAALVASLAFALSGRQRQWLNQTENRNDLFMARSLAQSAADLARLTLRDDLRNNTVDHLLETWTIPVPPIQVENAQVGGRLNELQGRFNLYNLQRGGKVDPDGIAAFQRLLALRSLPATWAEAMALAMAKQVALQEQHARTASLDPAMLVAVIDVASLAVLAGIQAEKLAPLRDWLTVLPERTAVNLNFAPPEILTAITPGLPLKDAENIVAKRAAKPFNAIQDFIQLLPESARKVISPSSYTVESYYFLSEIEAKAGRAQVRLVALIHRSRAGFPEFVWIDAR